MHVNFISNVRIISSRTAPADLEPAQGVGVGARVIWARVRLRVKVKGRIRIRIRVRGRVRIKVRVGSGVGLVWAPHTSCCADLDMGSRHTYILGLGLGVECTFKSEKLPHIGQIRSLLICR